MLKTIKLFASAIVLTLAVSGCSLTGGAYDNWHKNVSYELQGSYDRSQTLVASASDLKTLVDDINDVVPSEHFNIELSHFKEESWVNKACTEFNKNEDGIITQPLLGSTFIDMPVINGYISLQELTAIGKANNQGVNEETGIDLLKGSKAKLPYSPKRYSTQLNSDSFYITILADSGWNSFLWKQYPDKMNESKIDLNKHPMPTDSYMPFEIFVFYKGKCAN